MMQAWILMRKRVHMLLLKHRVKYVKNDRKQVVVRKVQSQEENVLNEEDVQRDLTILAEDEEDVRKNQKVLLIVDFHELNLNWRLRMVWSLVLNLHWRLRMLKDMRMV